MSRIPHEPLSPVSVCLLMLTFVLLPVFEVDMTYNPRAAVPAACASAAGVLTAFFAVRRLNGLLPIGSCLSLLLNAYLFVALIWELREKFGIGHATIQFERGDAAHPCLLAPAEVV